MPSSALVAWQGLRATRLGELERAHTAVGGSGPGRRTQTMQINWSLVLRLAGEFQGFSRDLHDLATQTFASWSAPSNQRLEQILLTLLTARRRLDKGNAEPGGLSEDFGRLGINWWPALTARDVRTKERVERLTRLNDARNAVAHANLAKLDTLRDDGYPLTLVTVARWRSALNGLAVTMDAEVAAHLATVFGRARPW